MNDDEFIPTRRSLLSRLKNWDDQESWKEFFDAYSRLIYRVATKAGLTDAEAQDVVQETVIVVARKIPDFKYDPALGSFKSWLLLITRRRIEKQFKKRMPVRVGLASRLSGAGEAPDQRADETKRTATVERVPDPNSFDLETAWDAEWERNLWDAALARVKAQVKPKQFQMFDLYVCKEWPVKEVARALGVSVADVYVIKHRVARLIREEIKAITRIPHW
ncbi:MAG: sigma-70 family RNA polymerase sigma factor [Verrucomicrobia bacterium]|nr:sigma-70 family RNA polymerase sigma factor [Verrucomicrobiota bacterium]